MVRHRRRLSSKNPGSTAQIGAALADQHFAIKHPRRAGDVIVRVERHRLRGPDRLPGLCVKREQTAVQGCEENLAIRIGNAAINRETMLHFFGIMLPDLRIIGPDDSPFDAVYGVNLAIGSGEK